MKYRTIVADPPWEMPTGGKHSGPGRWHKHNALRRPSELPYGTLPLQEILDLPVAMFAADDAHLYLWVPNFHLEASYSIARSWGFKPSQMLVWAKNPRGVGLGGAFTNTAEYVLFCRRGSLAPLNRQDTTWWNWKRPHNAHSAKPEGFLDLVERVSPAPRIELFARRARFGWDYWGDESLGTAGLSA
jgi:N6-adenosine-specific RNA methylase IME4